MRTTLDIDDDLLAAAKELARTQHTSAGRVVSQLLRQALAGRGQPEKLESASVGGFRPFAARGKVVTNEKVNELRDAEGL
jgi:predicted transcriptional regulator